MEDAFDHGYDSDGWAGPERGTDPKEVDALKEDELVSKTITEPVFISISDDALKKLTVSQIKHELMIRNVGLLRSKKKEALLGHLKDALAKNMPVFPPDQITTTKTGDYMADFAVGAEWKSLTLTLM